MRSAKPPPAIITLSSDDEDAVDPASIHPPARGQQVKVENSPSDGSQGSGHPSSAAREGEGPTQVPAGDDICTIPDPAEPDGAGPANSELAVVRTVTPSGEGRDPSTAESERLTVVSEDHQDGGGVDEEKEPEVLLKLITAI